MSTSKSIDQLTIKDIYVLYMNPEKFNYTQKPLNFQLYDLVIARDEYDTYLPAQIIGIVGDLYRVHFLGWSNKFDGNQRYNNIKPIGINHHADSFTNRFKDRLHLPIADLGITNLCKDLCNELGVTYFTNLSNTIDFKNINPTNVIKFSNSYFENNKFSGYIELQQVNDPILGIGTYCGFVKENKRCTNNICVKGVSDQATFTVYKPNLQLYNFHSISSYTGTWNNDQATGYGTIIYSNNDQYIGQVENFIPNGYGTMTMKVDCGLEAQSIILTKYWCNINATNNRLSESFKSPDKNNSNNNDNLEDIYENDQELLVSKLIRVELNKKDKNNKDTNEPNNNDNKNDKNNDNDNNNNNDNKDNKNIYVGSLNGFHLDNSQVSGIGWLFDNQSIKFGTMKMGKLNSQDCNDIGVYIFPDDSRVFGHFINNKVKDTGCYISNTTNNDTNTINDDTNTTNNDNKPFIFYSDNWKPDNLQVEGIIVSQKSTQVISLLSKLESKQCKIPLVLKDVQTPEQFICFIKKNTISPDDDITYIITSKKVDIISNTNNIGDKNNMDKNNIDKNNNGLKCIFNKDSKNWYFSNTSGLIKFINVTQAMISLNKTLEIQPCINNFNFDYSEFMKEREQLKCQLKHTTDQLNNLLVPYNNLLKTEQPFTNIPSINTQFTNCSTVISVEQE